ncbi:Guanine nucleotide exchange factor MSS4 [Melipona quadrifasciata]|uniref:Guanine nucleotide exchange factor MSS4 n=1 Tax=Melipona quadrifasciata TaxID=166423 RepID=A0A0N0BD35_9HYME|nr:Guanine nucleotide exchange factor MSS4 [Melipona quadrifasciata]
MTTNENISTLKDQDERNKLKVYCTFCPSKMLNAGVARLVNIEFNLPYIQRKGEGEADQQELITDYWLVEDMYTFENIGVSHTVDNVKPNTHHTTSTNIELTCDHVDFCHGIVVHDKLVFQRSILELATSLDPIVEEKKKQANTTTEARARNHHHRHRPPKSPLRAGKRTTLDRLLDRKANRCFSLKREKKEKKKKKKKKNAADSSVVLDADRGQKERNAKCSPNSSSPETSSSRHLGESNEEAWVYPKINAGTTKVRSE